MIVGKARDVPESRCLNCREILAAGSSIGTDADPRPDDITICIFCGHIMAFDGTLQLRELTNQEVVEIAGDRRIVAALQALIRLRE